MATTGNILNNNGLSSLERQAAPGVVNAIKKASARTGVDFAYLMEKASAESSFRPDVKAKTSSATGLFQFIEKTWLSMVREHGADYGLGKYAHKITADGRVADAKTRKEILELRKDPETAAVMAAEYAADNKAYLETRLKDEVGPVEMYLAHFMGPNGAASFLSAMKKNPMGNAADHFPEAARANRGVFYDQKNGKARTLANVYDFFAQKFENSTKGYQAAPQDNPTMIAAIDTDEQRMAGATDAVLAQANSAGVMKSNSYETDLLWAQEIFRNNQAQQLRVLASNEAEEATPAEAAYSDQRLVRNNQRFAHLNNRDGAGLHGAQGRALGYALPGRATVNNPVQVMQLAQADLHTLRSRYN